MVTDFAFDFITGLCAMFLSDFCGLFFTGFIQGKSYFESQNCTLDLDYYKWTDQIQLEY